MSEIENIENSNNLYQFSRELILNARQKVYQVANFTMVETYWHIGKKIVEEQNGEQYAKYGESILKTVSKHLQNEFGKSFSYVNLTNMRKFYQLFPNFYALRKELSWTHYRSLLRVENPKARELYMNEAAENSWSTRFLDQQVDKHYYERLISTHKETLNELKSDNSKHLLINPADFILKDPLLLDFYELKENQKFSENQVEQAIIDNLQKFLLELGKGFSFVTRQQRINTEFSHYYIDLVFYNYILKCFVLIDLKIGKLTHQDVGQMDMYVRMYDELKQLKEIILL